MIEKLRIARLRHAELLQFCDYVISTVTQNNPDTLLVTSLLTTLKTTNAEAVLLLNKEKASTITDELALLDERRDKAINGIIYFVEAHLFHFDPSINNQARVLKNNLDAHGNAIARENYQVETTILKKIIADWTTKPELMAACAALGLTNWLAELGSANNAFYAKFIERNNQQGTVSTEKLKEKRVEVTAAYEKLAERINSYYDINAGADPFGKVTRELNVLIEKYNTLLAIRSKGGEAVSGFKV